MGHDLDGVAPRPKVGVPRTGAPAGRLGPDAERGAVELHAVLLPDVRDGGGGGHAADGRPDVHGRAGGEGLGLSHDLALMDTSAGLDFGGRLRERWRGHEQYRGDTCQ